MKNVDIFKNGLKLGVNVGVMVGSHTLVKAGIQRLGEPKNKFQSYTIGVTQIVAASYISDRLSNYASTSIDEMVDSVITLAQTIASAKQEKSETNSVVKAED